MKILSWLSGGVIAAATRSRNETPETSTTALSFPILRLAPPARTAPNSVMPKG